MNIRRFQKRPVVIDAIQFHGTYDSYEDIVAAFGPWHMYWVPDLNILRIKTLEGPVTAASGDWIIRGVANELYPCRDDIFRATYDEVCDA